MITRPKNFFYLFNNTHHSCHLILLRHEIKSQPPLNGA
jgi:hypothetical protein